MKDLRLLPEPIEMVSILVAGTGRPSVELLALGKPHASGARSGMADKRTDSRLGRDPQRKADVRPSAIPLEAKLM